MSTTNDTPKVEESVKEEAKTTETTQVAPEKVEEVKVSDIYKAKDPEKFVGVDKFLELKKQNKELKKQMDGLQKMIEAGATKSDVKDELDNLAEEFQVDPAFLKKFAESIKSKSAKPDDKKTKEDDEEDEVPETPKNGKTVDQIFEEHYSGVISRLPEFADVVNKDVIKQLSLLKSNENKTLVQIIEDTYSKTLAGKRTVETSKPGGGKDPQPLDYAKAKRDRDYLINTVFADPDLKAEYNNRMLREGF